MERQEELLQETYPEYKMVKNLIGGNKAKSMSNKKQNIVKIKLFKAPNEFEHIGKINKELGSARFSVETYFNKRVYVVNCSAPKSIRVKIDDYVLISLLREASDPITLSNGAPTKLIGSDLELSSKITGWSWQSWSPTATAPLISAAPAGSKALT